MTNFEPEQVRQGRDKMLAGDRLPEHARELRPYYCRGCGAQQQSTLVPRGWYTLTRSSGSYEERPQRLGLYCSLGCIDVQMDRLIGIEAQLGERFDTAPSEFRQQNTWGR